MTTQELIRKILNRLGKLYWLILLIGAGLGFLLYTYAKGSPTSYTAKSSLYALTSKEVSATGGLISSLTGGGNNSGMGNLSEEATISLEELASSRRIRQNVAATKLPQFSNQTIASLLIQNEMKRQNFLSPKVTMPKAEADILTYGTSLVSAGLTAKPTKGDLFQISFTSSAQELVTPISYVFINELTAFFISLKVRKAQIDYDFTVRKIDSLRGIMYAYDRKAVAISNSTMFVPPGKIEYEIPKENLINDKTRVVTIYNGAANNKEEALWRLQRAKPILDLLDKPEPPYDIVKKSPIQYAIIGFLVGCILGLIICIMDIIFKFTKGQVNTAIFKEEIKTEVTQSTTETKVTKSVTSTTIVDVDTENKEAQVIN